MKSIEKPKIIVTMGDPCGVGPEILLKALALPVVKRACSLIVLGDEGLLNFISGKLGIKPLPKGVVLPVSSLDYRSLSPGRPDAETGRAMIEYVREAVRLVMEGKADALVTCPISKEAAKLGGFEFPGHTEFIAHLVGKKEFAMMLGGADLKVVLTTIHERLKRVPSLVTEEKVLRAIKIAHRAFRVDFGIKDPRIAICGLNPHAGEGGIFGDEDALKIAPAVKKARRLDINATGPLPADTVFYRAARKKEFDCVIAMYHDQGLGPLKLLHFEDGINATLGLPLIRTSVDHGTAYDIAWKGVASPKSLVSAILAAVEMAKNRKKQNGQHKDKRRQRT